MRRRVPRDDRVVPRPRRRHRDAAAAVRRLDARRDARGIDGARRSTRARDARRARRARRPRAAAYAVRPPLEFHALRRVAPRHAARPHSARSGPRSAPRAARGGSRVGHRGRARALAEPAVRATRARSGHWASRPRRQHQGRCRSARADPPARRHARDVRARQPVADAVGRRPCARRRQQRSPDVARARLRRARAFRARDGGAARRRHHALRGNAQRAVAGQRFRAFVAPAVAVLREAAPRRHRLAFPLDRRDSADGDDRVRRGHRRRRDVAAPARRDAVLQRAARRGLPRGDGDLSRSALARARAAARRSSRANRGGREAGQPLHRDGARRARDQALCARRRAPRRPGSHCSSSK